MNKLKYIITNRSKIAYFTLFIAVLSYFIYLCNNVPVGNLVNRIQSPDRQFDALIYFSYGGLNESTQEIYIVKHGDEVLSSYNKVVKMIGSTPDVTKGERADISGITFRITKWVNSNTFYLEYNLSPYCEVKQNKKSIKILGTNGKLNDIIIIVKRN